MTVTSRITAQTALPEHPDNGVERGFVDTQVIVLAAKRLDELAAGWRESRLLNVAVFRAMLLLTRSEPERAIVGRCEEAPAAHVFSFDHVRREGVRKM